MIPSQFEATAVLFSNAEKQYYHHFGIRPETCSLFGDKESDIVHLTMRIAEDQSTDLIAGTDYWGWYDNRANRFTLIYPQRFLLNMCFPHGLEATEEAGQGKAYRLEIAIARRTVKI